MHVICGVTYSEHPALNCQLAMSAVMKSEAATTSDPASDAEIDLSPQRMLNPTAQVLDIHVGQKIFRFRPTTRHIYDSLQNKDTVVNSESHDLYFNSSFGSAQIIYLRQCPTGASIPPP